MERYDRPRTPRVLGIDEFHLKDVLCVLTDLEGKKVFDLLPSFTKDYLDPYFTVMPDKDRVKVVVADMRRTYHDLARKHFPRCPVVVDKFHVVRFAQKGVDEIRKRTGPSFNEFAELVRAFDRDHDADASAKGGAADPSFSGNR